MVNLLHSSAILGGNVNSYPFATINVDINANPINLNYFNTGTLIKYGTGPRQIEGGQECRDVGSHGNIEEIAAPGP